MIYHSAEQLLFLHARLVDETGGSHSVRDLNMLLSALGRPGQVMITVIYIQTYIQRLRL